MVREKLTPGVLEDVVNLLNMGYTRKYIARRTRLPYRQIVHLATSMNIGRKAGDSKAKVVSRYLDTLIDEHRERTNRAEAATVCR